MLDSKDTARVIITWACPRHCPGCCNDQFEAGSIPYLGAYTDDVKLLSMYDTLVITGGEPLLRSSALMRWIVDTRLRNKKVLYTSYATLIEPRKLALLLTQFDGLTFSVHYEGWESNLIELQTMQKMLLRLSRGFDSRLSIDHRIDQKHIQMYINPALWHNIKSFEWKEPEDCPPPANEDLYFMKL